MCQGRSLTLLCHTLYKSIRKRNTRRIKVHYRRKSDVWECDYTETWVCRKCVYKEPSHLKHCLWTGCLYWCNPAPNKTLQNSYVSPFHQQVASTEFPVLSLFLSQSFAAFFRCQSKRLCGFRNIYMQPLHWIILAFQNSGNWNSRMNPKTPMMWNLSWKYVGTFHVMRPWVHHLITR